MEWIQVAEDGSTYICFPSLLQEALPWAIRAQGAFHCLLQAWEAM